jgi:hypothetical protein
MEADKMTTAWQFYQEEEDDPDRFISYCPTCECRTGIDGFGMVFDSNTVEWVCSDCLATKGTVAYEDCPAHLQSLIDRRKA